MMLNQLARAAWIENLTLLSQQRRLTKFTQQIFHSQKMKRKQSKCDARNPHIHTLTPEGCKLKFTYTAVAEEAQCKTISPRRFHHLARKGAPRTFSLSLISRVENQRGRLLACLLFAFGQSSGRLLHPLLDLAVVAATPADVINLAGDTGGVADRERESGGRVCERGHLFHVRALRPGPSGCQGRSSSSQAAGVPPRVGHCSSGSAAPGSIQITASWSARHSLSLSQVHKARKFNQSREAPRRAFFCVQRRAPHSASRGLDLLTKLMISPGSLYSLLWSPWKGILAFIHIVKSLRNWHQCGDYFEGFCAYKRLGNELSWRKWAFFLEHTHSLEFAELWWK